MVSLQSKSQCTGPTVLTEELIDCPSRFMVFDLSACVFHRGQIISAFVFSPLINVHNKMDKNKQAKKTLIRWLGKSMVSCGVAHKADVAFTCVPAKK